MRTTTLHAAALAALSLFTFHLSPFAAAAPAASASAPFAPPDPPAALAAGLAAHNHSLHLTSNWLRDPYLILGPDGYYYLTGTTTNENDPREYADPTGTGPRQGTNVCGTTVRLWRSRDLITWEYRGVIFRLSDSVNQPTPKPAKSAKAAKKSAKKSTATPAPIPATAAPTDADAPDAEDTRALLWAPELHWLPDQNRWAMVICPRPYATLALAPVGQLEPKGPWEQPLGKKGGDKHDTSLFEDTDHTVWLIWTAAMHNATIAPLNKTLTDFTAPPLELVPAGSRTNKNGRTNTAIGHEGTGIIKVPGSDKYVYFGTAWSTDGARKGSYNLYYCTADKITGPYGPRRFLGRFLGHGYPFQDKQGKWWCTAFYNANVPPLPRAGIEKRDISNTANTINPTGLTIVPLDITIQPDGDIRITSPDPAYATPGPDEVQKFN